MTAQLAFTLGHHARRYLRGFCHPNPYKGAHTTRTPHLWYQLQFGKLQVFSRSRRLSKLTWLTVYYYKKYRNTVFLLQYCTLITQRSTHSEAERAPVKGLYSIRLAWGGHVDSAGQAADRADAAGI